VTARLRTYENTFKKHIGLSIVLSHELKGWEKIGRGEVPEVAGSTGGSTRHREDFSLDGFYKPLLKWIAVDDQVGRRHFFNNSGAHWCKAPNVVDCPELRDLLLLLSADLRDADIPHRSTLTKLIIDNFQKEYEKLQVL